MSHAAPEPQPKLERCVEHGLAYWVDPALRARGVLVAFSERTGGVSGGRFASLNLAGHVGDDPVSVDENRARFLDVLGVARLRQRLTMAEQVHGEHIATVGESDAGRGAFASQGPGPLPTADAMVTCAPDVPLALCFADCVPVVLVAGTRAVAVVHAGWRGAMASLPGKAAEALAAEASCEVADLAAYIGAHICAGQYVVSGELLSQFVNRFGTFARAESGGLDLDAVVTASLETAGVVPCSITRLGASTAETTDRFYSYRAEGGSTGRHAALACLLPDGS